MVGISTLLKGSRGQMKLLVIVLVLLGSSITWGAADRCEESYVPPHTLEDLQDVSVWATGGAFYFYAEEAGYCFDRVAYNNDNPYLALFNFGRATGTSCLNIDVLRGYTSMAWVFQNLINKMNDPDAALERSFQEVYDDQAVKQGMDVYLTKLPDSGAVDGEDLLATNGN